MKLRDVMICLGCDEVFVPETIIFVDQKVTLEDCPSCTSRAVVRLCRWFQTMNTPLHPSQEGEKIKVEEIKERQHLWPQMLLF